jgi:hypothetical protein
VVKGYPKTQKHGVDFEEVYAPVSKDTMMRALLAVVACSQNMELHQLDEKMAFLNGELEDEIYMQQANGYKEGGPGIVRHLKKTLYGLRQAFRTWHTPLKAELEALGFRASKTNLALFVKGAKRQATYMLVWVDETSSQGWTGRRERR